MSRRNPEACGATDADLRRRLSRWLDAMLVVKQLEGEIAALSAEGVVEQDSARAALERLDGLRNELIDGMIF